MWRNGDRSIQLLTTRHERTLSAVLAAALDADGPRDIRGNAGRKGYVVIPGHDGKRLSMWTWPEGDLDVAVTAKGVSDEELEVFVRSLRTAMPADWQRLTREASRPRVEDRSDELSVSGSFDGGWWVVTSKRFGPESLDLAVSIRLADGGFGGGGGGSAPARPMVTMQGAEAGILFYGYGTSDAASVEVETEDGMLLEAVVQRREGWPISVFAVLVPPGTVVTRVTVLESDGTRYERLARMTAPEGTGGGGGELRAIPAA